MSVVSSIKPALLNLPSPLLLIPRSISNKTISTVFNQAFSQSITDGELDFLTNKWVFIKINDLNVSFCLSLNKGKIICADNEHISSLRISANSCDFLSMIAKEKDPDTLFFQRKITMQGSTELGLYVKNFLDAFDTDSSKIAKLSDNILAKIYPFLRDNWCNK